MNIIELDPYNDSQLEEIKAFEDENNCLDKLSKNIIEIQKNNSREEYYDSNKNEFEKIIITEENSAIIDCYYIHGEKDIKQCKIIPITKNNKKRKTVEKVTDYALKNLGMEEVFIPISKENESMITYLELRGYENLGEVEGNILFLKEKLEKENSQRMIS